MPCVLSHQHTAELLLALEREGQDGKTEMERDTRRHEFADPRQFVQAGFAYASYQLLQLVLTATFVPTADPRAFDVAQECMKAFITLCDCLGLYRMFAPRRMAQVCPSAR